MTKKKKMKISLQNLLYVVFLSLLFSAIFLFSETLLPVPIPEEGKPAEFYSNQANDDLRAVFTSAINKAEKSIILIIYSLTDDAVINELRKKGESGVDVRVICDAKAPFVAAKLGPKVKLFRRISEGLMHQKILVVDGARTWIGSANLTSESLRMHGNLVNAFHSVGISSAVTEKALRLCKEEETQPITTQTYVVGGQELELWFLPDNARAHQRLIQLIKSAEKTIRVAMFTWTRYDLARSIIEAKERGVDVKVAIDALSSKGASKKIVKLLKSHKIPVYVNASDSLLHHKFLYIDGKVLANGSANWTKAAFTKNDDCFIILRDLNEDQREKMNQLWKTIVAESK